MSPNNIDLTHKVNKDNKSMAQPWCIMLYYFNSGLSIMFDSRIRIFLDPIGPLTVLATLADPLTVSATLAAPALTH